MENLGGDRRLTVSFDDGEDLLFEADLLDVLHVGVPQKEELVGEHEVELLSPFLTFHGESTRFGLNELGCYPSLSSVLCLSEEALTTLRNRVAKLAWCVLWGKRWDRMLLSRNLLRVSMFYVSFRKIKYYIALY